jgi:rod shape-determining protein MreC
MDRSPPAFFNQGPSAHARLALCAVLAIALLVVDARMGALAPLRQGVATVLHPLQVALLAPRDLGERIADHVAGVERLRADNAELRRVEAANALMLLQAEQAASENRQLRELIGARERAPLPTVIAEVLRDARDPFTRRLVIDRGLQHGLLAGQPVIDAEGVVGQVTRVLPLSAEVTLLTDRGATLPVEIARTGQRAIAFGDGVDGLLELRFLAASTDVQPDDTLVTSGLDGIYPPGLPVGRVVRIEPAGTADVFGRVLAQPAAAADRRRLLLVLRVDRPALPAAADPAPAEPKRRKGRGD